tara:strand:- start:6760 stop:7662 length:903 start_codon:yes stop_codon:yes gene_type:complete
MSNNIHDSIWSPINFSGSDMRELVIKTEVKDIINELIKDVIEIDTNVGLGVSNEHITSMGLSLNNDIHEGGNPSLPLPFETHPYDQCSICHFSRELIEKRCSTIYATPPDSLQYDGGQFTCHSCQYEHSFVCSVCNVSEELVRVTCDRNVQFMEMYVYNNGWRPEYYCPECYRMIEEEHDSINEIYNGSNNNEGLEEPDVINCILCGGNHLYYECPYEYYDNNFYNDEYEIDTNGDLSNLEDDNISPRTIVDGSVFNEGRNDIIKEFKELMELFDELSDSIQEGQYIDIMNKMKVIFDKL